jgi:hypothetical protein
MSETTKANNHGESKVLKGLAVGLIGGLVASWTMNRFQDLWFRLSADGESTGTQSEQADDAREEHAKGDSEEREDTTVKAASAVSEGLFEHRLTAEEKKIAGPAVHYVLGTGVGGIYGAVAEVVPQITAGAGLPFGAAFWLVVDETAVPLLGLSKGPTKYPLSTHVYALTSHFVYGLTAEVVRRSLRKAL